MADRPGLQYPTIQADPKKVDSSFKSSLDGALKNYGDNLFWLRSTVDSLQEALSNVKTEVSNAATILDSSTSGVYNPTAIKGVNVTDALASQAQWMRIGNVVAVSGILVVTPTATGPCNTDLTLPFAATITDRAQLAGTAAEENGVDTGSVLGNTASFNANVEWTATATTPYNLAYTFIYQSGSNTLIPGSGGGGGGGGGGGVMSVTATPPLASSGGIAPNISVILPSDPTKYLDGDGNFTVPTGTLASGYWTILTNGNLVTPEIIFAGGDVISFFVPT